MRAGARQSFRERRELQESEKRQMVITDDDEDDDDANADADDAVELLNVALGEGVFGKLGSDADRAATAIATSPREGGGATTDGDDDGGDLMRLGGGGGAVGDSENVVDDGLDFLLDLGLDMLEEDDEDGGIAASVTASTLQGARSGVSPLTPPANKVEAAAADDDDIDFDDEDVSVSSAISVEVDDEDDDDAIDFGVDDDDEVAGVADDEDEMDDSAGSGSGLDEVSLDDYGDNDGLDNNIFDEGGFDYDDYENDNDGGDMW
jgi:hypothetical protein